GQLDRRHRALGVEQLRVVDHDVAAPAIDHGVEVGAHAGDEIGVAAARAEADHADLAVGVRLRPQEGRAGAGVAHHLLVGDAASRTHARADVIGAAGSFAEIEVRCDGRKAVVRELTGRFGDPFVPAGQVMDHDDAGHFAGPGRPRVIGFALVAV